MKKKQNKTRISVYDVIEELKRTDTYFHLISTLPYAITICVAIPGQRIEIDVYEDEIDGIQIAHFTGEEVSDLTLTEFYKLISE